MKKLFKLTLVLAAAALTLTGCDCFKKMAKDPSVVTVTCTPDVLVLNNGKVVADVTAEIPAKYFNKKAALKVTPALVYEGGLTKGNTLVLQGEKIVDNGMVVKNAEAFSISRHLEFDYKPEMQRSQLVLIVEVKCKSGKCKEYSLINANTGERIPADSDLSAAEYGLVIAQGINTLQSDLDFSVAMQSASNNYKRVTTVTTKADIVYKINSSKVENKAIETAEIQSLKADVDANKTNERVSQTVYVKGYASPDGPEQKNNELSEKRSQSGMEAIQKLFDDAGLKIDAAAYGEDWEGFQEAVAASNIADKDLILQVLNMYASSAEREKEIKNMAAVFGALKTDVLPQLRRAQVVNSADITGWSDDEMIEIVKGGQASTLKLEELLHVASVSEEVAEAALTEAVKSGDARAWNNLALVYAKAGNYEKAIECLNNADKSVATQLNNNYALAYAAEGDIVKAEGYIINASAETKALIAAAKGEYATAAQTLKSGYNAAIVNLQNGNLTAAKQCLANDSSAKADYLRAVIACREGDVNGAKAQLNSAIAKDGSLKAKADKDVNLAALK
jgi:outer membrane protein OmpA-like peptidoglycan-associated protein/cellobiose-specific phosphotransferase system component IIA